MNGNESIMKTFVNETMLRNTLLPFHEYFNSATFPLRENKIIIPFQSLHLKDILTVLYKHEAVSITVLR